MNDNPDDKRNLTITTKTMTITMATTTTIMMRAIEANMTMLVRGHQKPLGKN